MADVPDGGERGLDVGDEEGDAVVVEGSPRAHEADQDGLTGAGGGVEDLGSAGEEVQHIDGVGVTGLDPVKEAGQDLVQPGACFGVLVLGVQDLGDVLELLDVDLDLVEAGPGGEGGKSVMAQRLGEGGKAGDGDAPVDDLVALVAFTGLVRVARRGEVVGFAPAARAPEGREKAPGIAEVVPAQQGVGRVGGERIAGQGEQLEADLVSFLVVSFQSPQEDPGRGGEPLLVGEVGVGELHHLGHEQPFLSTQLVPAIPCLRFAAGEKRRMTEGSQRLAVVVLLREVVRGQGQRGPDERVLDGQLAHAHLTPALWQTILAKSVMVAAFIPYLSQVRVSRGIWSAR